MRHPPSGCLHLSVTQAELEALILSAQRQANDYYGLQVGAENPYTEDEAAAERGDELLQYLNDCLMEDRAIDRMSMTQFAESMQRMWKLRDEIRIDL